MTVFGNRIKLDPDLMQKVQKCAEQKGYSSAEEFVVHLLEKETARILNSGGGMRDQEEEVKKRLRGLGYIE